MYETHLFLGVLVGKVHEIPSGFRPPFNEGNYMADSTWKAIDCIDSLVAKCL